MKKKIQRTKTVGRVQEEVIWKYLEGKEEEKNKTESRTEMRINTSKRN